MRHVHAEPGAQKERSGTVEKGRRARRDWRRRLRRINGENVVCIPKAGRGPRGSQPVTSGTMTQLVGVRKRPCLVRRGK